MSRSDEARDPLLSRWREVDHLFEEALELEPEQRDAFLEDRCSGDPELRRLVDELLEESEGLEGFMGRPSGPGPFAGSEDLLLGGLKGLQLGVFQLEELVGRGGLGVVYRARRVHGGFDQEVAVKLLLDPWGEGVIRRFERERAILASLNHPGIATLMDGGTAPDGRPYLVMEFVDGIPITDYCEEAGLGISERLGLFVRVCDAVASAHAQLVVHRDLKPSNILITPQGDPKLLDFGIATLLDPQRADGSHATRLTRTGIRALSPAFASPEQVQGDPATIPSDVFQLGALLYQMLTGRRPHAGADASPASLVAAICEEDPPAPSAAIGEEGGAGLTPAKLRARLSGDLDTIILKALRKDPTSRYGSVAQLADDIRRHLDGMPVRARAASKRYRAGRFLARHRTAVALVSTLVVGLVVGIAGLLVHSSRLEVERDRAQAETERAEALAGFLLDLFDDAEESGALDTLSVGHLLARGEERLLGRTEDPPEVRVELLGALQDAYARTGLTGPLQRVQDARIHAVRELYGPNHFRTGEALISYGWQLRDRQQFQRATEVFEEGLSILRAWERRAGGPATELRREWDTAVDPEVVSALHSGLRGLATALRDAGQVDEALAVTREYLALREATAGDDRSPGQIELDLGQLAFALRGQERYEEAADLYEEAIRQGRLEERGVHPGTLNNYGSLLRTLDRSTESEAHFREARALLWPEEGEEPSSNLDTVQMNLVALLRSLGRHEAAREVAQEFLTLLRRTHRWDHWRVGRATYLVGRVHADGEACHLAEPYLRQALEIYDAELGAEHIWTAGPSRVLGLCLLDLGRPGEAEGVLLRTHAILEGAADGGHRASDAALLEGLVQVYQFLDQSDSERQYRALLQEAVEGEP